MGRILRFTLAEDQVHGIDLGFPKPGKLLIRNAGSNDVRIGFDPSDVNSTTGVNYYTIEAAITLVFDVSDFVGLIEQQQQMYFNSPDGDNVMEFWFAN